MADYTYVTATGVIVPDTGDLLALVQQEYRDTFGQNLILTPSSPQGVLIAAEVLARSNVLQNNATVANQINPNLAGGVFLDAVWSLTGGARRAATRTVLPGVLLAGVATTVVPAFSQAQTSGGTLFYSAGQVVLDASGQATVDFIAVEYGPLTVAPGALSQVVSAVLGWETVTNPTDGVPGVTEESDVASRARRSRTLALQGVALPEAMKSALYDVDGVLSLTFRENVEDTTQVIDGATLLPHSIYAVVDGGTDTDVAAAILAAKSGGSNFNGSVEVDVTDPSSGQVYPVLFDRPVKVPILARVTVRVGGATGNPQTLVEMAILDFAAGRLDQEEGFVVGASVSPFELSGAINREAAPLYVKKLELALASDGVFSTDDIELTIQQQATITASSIAVITV